MGAGLARDCASKRYIAGEPTASCAPAAPSRCPCMDFVELTGIRNLRAKHLFDRGGLDTPFGNQGSVQRVLQMRHHAHAAVDVLRGYGDDFLADTMKFEIDAHIGYGQIADAQRLDADG